MTAFLIAALSVALAAPAETPPDLWLLSIDRWGNAEHKTLMLEPDGEAVAGRLGERAVEGTRTADHLNLSTRENDGATYALDLTIQGDALTGWADYPDTNVEDARARHPVRGVRLTPPEGPPRRRTHTPTAYSNLFTADLPPVMVVRPGDVVVTRTIDSGGVDADGRTAALYGNPQTGPFFVLGAKPGDVLAVHIGKLALNRDYADSLDGVTGRAMSLGMARRMQDLGKRVRWRLDRTAGTARLENPPPALADYVVPTRPMLGGLAVAPDFGFPPMSAGDTGRFGGNMDFNQIGEGATVYLPVFQPGAMLFIGDGHALQGDGETTQWALETSLDVEFSVDILPARAMATPRIETDERLSALGQAGSLDEAVRIATAGMIQWLVQDYGLSDREASLILGVAAEYRIATLAGQNAGVALSLDKARLTALRRDEP